MTILPVSNIINVSITNTPSGLTERNVNSLALFTTEDPLDLETYGIYVSASQVAAQYGTNSVTAAMANAIFAQSPNIRSGGGRLVIFPLQSSVSATAGYVDTANLSANLANLLLVDDGDLKVTINSVAYNLTGLNFTTSTTWTQVAAVIQAKLQEGVVTALANGLKFTSKKVGTDSTVALAAVSGGAGTNLAAAGYLNSAGASATIGANATGETLLAAISRTAGVTGYTGVITNLDMQDSVIDSTADGIQAQDLIWIHHLASTQDIAGIATTVKDASNTKTRLITYTKSIADSNLAKSAYASRGMSVQISGSNTAGSMNLKGLATITPDTGITQTLYDAAKIAGTDIYVSFDGVAGVAESYGNDWFYNIYDNLAIKFGMESNGFNYLRQTNTKVPQTEAGMIGLKSAYRQIAERFVNNGSIAPGEWTSSEFFGNSEIFRQNIREFGYYIYSEPIARQSSSDRELRKAPLVQIAFKRAGAINSSDVIILIND